MCRHSDVCVTHYLKTRRFQLKKETISTIVLLLLVVFFSVLFLSMIRSFLMVIFLSAIFSALATPLYKKFVNWFKGRRSLASVTTLLLIVVVILIPLGRTARNRHGPGHKGGRKRQALGGKTDCATRCDLECNQRPAPGGAYRTLPGNNFSKSRTSRRQYGQVGVQPLFVPDIRHDQLFIHVLCFPVQHVLFSDGRRGAGQ